MRIIKTLFLTLALTLLFTMPAFADETTDANIAQGIAAVRQLELFGMVTVDARIFDLETELVIHKLKVEPNSAFVGAVQGITFSDSDIDKLTLKGRKFNSIAIMCSYGLISDDDALSQLQTLSLTQ